MPRVRDMQLHKIRRYLGKIIPRKGLNSDVSDNIVRNSLLAVALCATCNFAKLTITELYYSAAGREV